MAYRNGQRLPLDDGGLGSGSGPTLRLSVNPRARRLSVRIDARAGEAVVIAPTERGLAQAVADLGGRATRGAAQDMQGSPEDQADGGVTGSGPTGA